MPNPILTPERFDEVSGLVSQYIATQRENALPHALRLSPAERAAMEGFFLPEVLDGTRLLILDGIRVQNPDFYPMLRGMGFENLPDFRLMAAITFSDVVVSHAPFTQELLFHELVHVEQYRQLGIDRFAELYVRGFLSGGGYGGIPLEMNAYQLGEKFGSNPQEKFSVADEVSRWISEARF
jgi:hypothetical protein